MLGELQVLAQEVRQLRAEHAAHVATVEPRLAVLETDAQQTPALEDIKRELTSLKGLMLNPRQFPTVVSPGIPAWQKNRILKRGDDKTALPDRANGTPVTSLPLVGTDPGDETEEDKAAQPSSPPPREASPSAAPLLLPSFSLPLVGHEACPDLDAVRPELSQPTAVGMNEGVPVASPVATREDYSTEVDEPGPHASTA